MIEKKDAQHGMDENCEEFSMNDEDILGTNSEIATRLRAFYTAVQEETVPERFLDLLEKLDAAEQAFEAADTDEKDIKS